MNAGTIQKATILADFFYACQLLFIKITVSQNTRSHSLMASFPSLHSSKRFLRPLDGVYASRDGIFWLPAGKDATERLPWLLEHLAVQLVLSSGAGESRASRLGGLGGRGKQVIVILKLDTASSWGGIRCARIEYGQLMEDIEIIYCRIYVYLSVRNLAMYARLGCLAKRGYISRYWCTTPFSS